MSSQSDRSDTDTTQWRIGVFPDHGAPLDALDDNELVDLHRACWRELTRRGWWGNPPSGWYRLPDTE